MANLNELMTAILLGKMTDIVTLPGSPVYLRVPNLNRAVWGQGFVSETNAGEIGRGHEFPTSEFKSHIDNGLHQHSCYLSAEMMAHVMAFGLGNVVKTGTTPNFTYTCVPLMPATDARTELPYFAFAQQMRPGASSVLDQLYLGCVYEDWRLAVNKSPGRQSATLTASMRNSGKVTEPSAVTIPAEVAMREMRSNLLTTLTINGVDYLASKGFERCEASWSNNIRQGFYPGAGLQDGFQIQGRLEVGDRVPTFMFVARFENGSSELTKVKALTTGSVTMTFTFDSNNSVALTWPSMSFAAASIGEEGGVVTVQVTGNPKYDVTNGIFSAVVKVSGAGYAGICQ